MSTRPADRTPRRQRPGARRPGTAGPAGRREARTPGPRRSALTTRAAVLGLAVCAVVLSLAYPLRAHLAQRAELAELRQTVAGQQGRVAALEDQRRRLEDPAYVRAEARRRLQYVEPGETAYIVLAPTPTAAPSRVRAQRLRLPAEGPWYSRLWGSAQSAGAAPVTRPSPAPTP